MSDTSMFSKEDMIRKVASLIETAESFAEQGNDEAAQSYVQKAHTLQQKYSIDQAMLAERTGRKTEKIISKKIRMNGKWGKQKVYLAHLIANATQCTGYFRTGRGTKMGPGLVEVTDWDGPKLYYYIVFGFESDVDHVEFLVNSLSHQLDIALSYAQKNKNYWEHGRSFNASFCLGFSNTISSRLCEAARNAERSVQNESNCVDSTSVALVLVGKKKLVNDEMRAVVGKLGKGSSSTVTSNSGYYAGREAGSRATIARGGVSGGSKGALPR